jgi:type VI secretion system protein ImpH
MEDTPVGLRRIEAALRKSPSAFGFFQAVRILESLRPDRAGVGEFVDPSEEVARFSVRPSLAFPASEVHGLEIRDDGPARMSVNFMGLTGPSGVLPHVYTQLVAERQRARDRATAEFLDIFHHRMISLFYRAWKKHHVAASAGTEDDHFREYLLDLAGLGLKGMQGRLPVADDAMVFYLGLLGPQPRGAGALQQLLEDYFDVPVEVEQFVGAWHPVPLRDQFPVGAESGPADQLGLGALVGDEVWDAQARVRLRIGPLSRARFEEFLPTGGAHEPLRALVRFFSHDQFEFEVQLVLAGDEVQGFVLGAEPQSPQPLGWSTWIRSTATAPARDADETVFTL